MDPFPLASVASSFDLAHQDYSWTDLPQQTTKLVRQVGIEPTVLDRAPVLQTGVLPLEHLTRGLGTWSRTRPSPLQTGSATETPCPGNLTSLLLVALCI